MDEFDDNNTQVNCTSKCDNIMNDKKCVDEARLHSAFATERTALAGSGRKPFDRHFTSEQVL